MHAGDAGMISVPVKAAPLNLPATTTHWLASTTDHASSSVLDAPTQRRATTMLQPNKTTAAASIGMNAENAEVRASWDA